MLDLLITISILTGFLIISWCVLYLTIITIPNILKKTIFKKSEYNKALAKVKYNLGYNQEMIKLYKGEISTVSEQYKDNTGICYCFKSWDYPRQIGIDEELLQQGVESEEEALKWNDIYCENKRKENIQARLKFAEEELKDIKRRII